VLLAKKKSAKSSSSRDEDSSQVIVQLIPSDMNDIRAIPRISSTKRENVVDFYDHYDSLSSPQADKLFDKPHFLKGASMQGAKNISDAHQIAIEETLKILERESTPEMAISR